MGYMRHHAIVVTSWNVELMVQAHAKAIELGMSVSGITNEVSNGYRSFLVAPDGSKEGWGESDRGDDRRDALIKWLDGQRYEDNSTALKWVVVQFGDEEKETLVIRDSDQYYREAQPLAEFLVGAKIEAFIPSAKIEKTFPGIETVHRITSNGMPYIGKIYKRHGFSATAIVGDAESFSIQADKLMTFYPVDVREIASALNELANFMENSGEQNDR
jgi:hypothetical protein